jgi:ATP-dependent Lon protease
VIDHGQHPVQLAAGGSESFWSNSEPGVFELLAYQPLANPVIVLDELDKTDQQRQYDPLAALYTLLEPAARATSSTSRSATSLSTPAT